MIEKLPMNLLHLHEVGAVLFILGLGGYLLLRARTGRPGGVTKIQHFAHRILFAMGFVLWMAADAANHSWGMLAFDTLILLLIGAPEIELVWVKLMAWRAARAQN